MEQFTFYDLYSDVINQLTDEEAGVFSLRLFNYAIFEREDNPSKSETVNCYWEIIFPTLAEATEIEKSGKRAHYLNRKMRHFTFKAAYVRMIAALKDEETAGKFVKAICVYMFEGREPTDLQPPIDSYFNLFRKSLDISKAKSESGKKGGKHKKKHMTFSEFMRRNPQIKDDVYDFTLKDNKDWGLLHEKIHASSAWTKETRLWRLLANYNAIISKAQSKE